MNYVYIDESGDEGTHSKYIIFASITLQDPRYLEKLVKKIWRAKPQFHPLGEFHAKEVDDSTRKRVLQLMTDLPIIVRHEVLDKRRYKSPIINAYYAILAGFISSHDRPAMIIVDRKDTNKRRSLVIGKLGLQQSFKHVAFEESHRIKQLQAVDFVAWSLGRLYEHNDSTYYDLIKHKESPSL